MLRSVSAVGKSYASTIAIVRPAPAVLDFDNEYTLFIVAGGEPDGATSWPSEGPAPCSMRRPRSADLADSLAATVQQGVDRGSTGSGGGPSEGPGGQHAG